MSSESWTPRKVVIIGAGSVGATFAYALALDGSADEIVLNDVNHELAEGQVLDLSHGAAFMPPVNIHAGEPKDYADAQLIVLTAGAKQRPNESRLELLNRNVSITRAIMRDIVEAHSTAVVLVVANPVDLLTHIAIEESGWSTNRILGSGTVLDSARFRFALSRHCGVDARNVHAYILGEHGDSEVPAWSMTHIAGMKMDDYCAICRKCKDWHAERALIADDVRRSAYHIIEYKGATWFAVGLALVRIAGAILRDERSVLTVSTLLEGQYRLQDVCLSVPCIVGRHGVELRIEGTLTESESEALHKSASVLKESHAQLKPS